jgi:hypothetical protein
MKRVTNLEDFCLTQIMRPYQSMIGYEVRLVSLPETLDEITDRLSVDTEWSRCVMDRVNCIGFTFPDYIKHPLVDLVRASRAAHMRAKP